MGKGDRRTAKGKRNISSYGNARKVATVPKAVTKVAATPKAPVAKKAPAKKTAK